MVKLRHYLVNAFISSLIGALVEISHAVIRHHYPVTFPGMLVSMAIGAIIGSISMVLISRMIASARKPFRVYTTNLLVVAAVFSGVSLYFSRTIISLGSPAFLFSLILVELLSCLLISVWYRYSRRLNQQLVRKKAELE